ncbi:MFS transporter [Methylosinus sp. H3A]|uniref:MFS transporter n=1 Tax=Methylosinus sp. H3A TaxID=2785786 RepID=UPI001FEEB530|nr:MFS transporter [Methylosinus sp. H3A]
MNLKIDPFLLHYTILGYSVVFIAAMILAGWLSDRIGRKPVVLAGFIGTALAAYPVFLGVTLYAHPRLAAAMTTHPVTVAADPATCSRQFDPFGLTEFHGSCDIARRAVAKLGVPYRQSRRVTGRAAQVEIGAAVIPAFEGGGLDRAIFTEQAKAFDGALAAALADAGYPARAAPETTNVRC